MFSRSSAKLLITEDNNFISLLPVIFNLWEWLDEEIMDASLLIFFRGLIYSLNMYSRPKKITHPEIKKIPIIYKKCWLKILMRAVVSSWLREFHKKNRIMAVTAVRAIRVKEIYFQNG